MKRIELHLTLFCACSHLCCIATYYVVTVHSKGNSLLAQVKNAQEKQILSLVYKGYTLEGVRAR